MLTRTSLQKYLRFFVYPEYYEKEIKEKGTLHAGVYTTLDRALLTNFLVQTTALKTCDGTSCVRQVWSY